MAEFALNNPEFEIIVMLSGEEKTLKVHPAETSDGVAYYKCSSGTDEITQIRKEAEGKWEQLWGQLDQRQVDTIGIAIEKEKY